MAGDWIKLEHVTPDKPEVHAMADTLGIDSDAVVGKLLRFWIWCDAQSVAGGNLGVSKSFLDRLCHQPGFSDALLSVDWLRVRSGSLEVPHFDRHNGQTAKARAVDARKKATYRKRDKCPDELGTNVPIETGQKPDQRREEKSKKRERAGVSAPAPDDLGEKAKTILDAYPRKEKTADALGVVIGHLRAGESFEAMLTGTRACAAVIRSMPSGPLNRYCPGALAFFLAKRWADDPETLRRQGNSTHGGCLTEDEVTQMLGGRANAGDEILF